LVELGVILIVVRDNVITSSGLAVVWLIGVIRGFPGDMFRRIEQGKSWLDVIGISRG